MDLMELMGQKLGFFGNVAGFAFLGFLFYLGMRGMDYESRKSKGKSH